MRDTRSPSAFLAPRLRRLARLPGDGPGSWAQWAFHQMGLRSVGPLRKHWSSGPFFAENGPYVYV